MSALTDLIAQSPALATRIQTALDDLKSALVDREALGAQIISAAMAVLTPKTKPNDAAIMAAGLRDTALPRDSGVVAVMRTSITGSSLADGDVTFSAVSNPTQSLVAATVAGAAQATATAQRWEA